METSLWATARNRFHRNHLIRPTLDASWSRDGNRTSTEYWTDIWQSEPRTAQLVRCRLQSDSRNLHPDHGSFGRHVRPQKTVHAGMDMVCAMVFGCRFQCLLTQSNLLRLLPCHARDWPCCTPSKCFGNHRTNLSTRPSERHGFCTVWIDCSRWIRDWSRVRQFIG